MTDPRVLDDEITANAIEVLDLASAPEDQKLAALDALSENILARVVVVVFEKLPVGLRDEFQSYIGSSDTKGLMTFLNRHVTDFPALLVQEAQEEIAETKELLGVPETAR